MKEMINVADLLRDCPKGMKLNCLLYDKPVTLNKVETYERSHPIEIVAPNGTIVTLTKYGTFYTCGESRCILFPENKDTWDNFPRPFRDGDIIIDSTNSVCIFKKEGFYNETVDFYCGIDHDDNFLIKEGEYEHFGLIKNHRLANEKEKERLFNAIEENGYRWNSDTKTLEDITLRMNLCRNKRGALFLCDHHTVYNVKDDIWTNCIANPDKRLYHRVTFENSPREVELKLV